MLERGARLVGTGTLNRQRLDATRSALPFVSWRHASVGEVGVWKPSRADASSSRMEAARMIVRAKGLNPSTSCQLIDLTNAEAWGVACALHRRVSRQVNEASSSRADSSHEPRRRRCSLGCCDSETGVMAL